MRTSRSWVGAILDRLLYQRTRIWLTSTDWYERLSLATGRDGWQVVRVDGALVQLERPRLRLR